MASIRRLAGGGRVKAPGSRRVLGVAVAACLAGTAGCVKGSDAPSACFTARAPLPGPRVQHALVATGGRLYAIGGASASATLARVDRYDPAADGWTQVADLSAARRDFAAGVVGGKIYVACGSSYATSDRAGITYVTATEEYDPAADTWTTRAAGCPVPHGVHLAGVAAGGRLYLLACGDTGTAEGVGLYAYDPAADAWSTRALPPFPFYCRTYSMAELGGQVYALTGETPLIYQPGHFARYDPAADAWTVLASQDGVTGGTLVAHQGALYALGGNEGAFDRGPAIADVNRYDPATGAWTAAGRLVHGRYLGAAVEEGGVVYLAGGSSEGWEWALAPVASVEAASALWCPTPRLPEVGVR